MKKNLSPHILPAWHFPTVLLSLLLLFVPLGCADDDAAETGRATVKMIFTTRASAQADGQTQLADRERMHTLRVIMQNAQTGKILYNVFYNNVTDGQKVITFQDVPVEEKGTNFNFYAIANEASFLDTGESLEGKELKLEELYRRTIDIDFNAEDKKNLPLPQAMMNQKLIQPIKATQTHTIQLEYPVAKVCVHFTNDIEAEQTVRNIKIPGLAATEGTLFPQISNAATKEIPPIVGLDASDISFAPNPLTVSAGKYGGPLGTGKVTPLYVYPAQRSDNKYQLTANWPDETTQKSVDLNATHLLDNGILRGMQLNIGIALKYGVMQLSGLTVTVDNWDTAAPIYPEFK
jgi:hypothetical protein